MTGTRGVERVDTWNFEDICVIGWHKCPQNLKYLPALLFVYWSFEILRNWTAANITNAPSINHFCSDVVISCL